MVKYNHEWFLKRVQEKRPEDYKEYIFVETYKTAKERITAIHTPCGREIQVLPNTFISRGDKCRFCSREGVAKAQTKSHEDYIKELPKSITLLSEYKGAHAKVKVHCSTCDNEYEIRARDLARRGCSRCSRKFKRSLYDVKVEVDKVTHGEYVVEATSYKNAHTKILIRHLDCNRTYEVTMANFRKGRRCPHCRASTGEKLVEMFLVKHGIKYEKHKKYPDLRYVDQLSYDFYLPSYNTLIEYQGVQHYEPVEFYGGLDQFIIQVEIDNIKRNYAQGNGYRLIEVPYIVDAYEDVESFLKTRLI